MAFIACFFRQQQQKHKSCSQFNHLRFFFGLLHSFGGSADSLNFFKSAQNKTCNESNKFSSEKSIEQTFVMLIWDAYSLSPSSQRPVDIPERITNFCVYFRCDRFGGVQRWQIMVDGNFEYMRVDWYGL